MPTYCCWGWRQSTGSSLCVFVIIHIALYRGLCRRFGRKPDGNRPTWRDGVGQNIRYTCCTDKVESSGCALCVASEKLVRVDVDYTWKSVGRCHRASIQRAVRTLTCMSLSSGEGSPPPPHHPHPGHDRIGRELISDLCIYCKKSITVCLFKMGPKRFWFRYFLIFLQ